MQMFSLKGACSLVTGGAGALGSRMCEGLAQAGSDVVILDLAIEKAEALAKSLQRYGVRVRAYALDTTDEEQAERVCEKIVEEFGRIDVLVNAAGIPNKGTLVEDNNCLLYTSQPEQHHLQPQAAAQRERFLSWCAGQRQEHGREMGADERYSEHGR